VDVSDQKACAEAVRQAVALRGAPAWAIACAGIVWPIRFLDQSLAQFVDQMDTNYFGTLHFARAVVPTMIAGGGGKLVFIASGSAICGLYGYSGYGASKFALRGLAEALRVELHADGIDVTLAYPPDTRTPQLEAELARRSEITSRIADAGGVWQPEAVADRIVAAVLRRKFLVLPGAPLRLLYALQGLIAPFFRLWQQRIVLSILTRR
jgi:3-dehydrosphinganine reductase